MEEELSAVVQARRSGGNEGLLAPTDSLGRYGRRHGGGRRRGAAEGGRRRRRSAAGERRRRRIAWRRSWVGKIGKSS